MVGTFWELSTKHETTSFSLWHSRCTSISPSHFFYFFVCVPQGCLMVSILFFELWSESYIGFCSRYCGNCPLISHVFLHTPSLKSGHSGLFLQSHCLRWFSRSTILGKHALIMQWNDSFQVWHACETWTSVKLQSMLLNQLRLWCVVSMKWFTPHWRYKLN